MFLMIFPTPSLRLCSAQAVAPFGQSLAMTFCTLNYLAASAAKSSLLAHLSNRKTFKTHLTIKPLILQTKETDHPQQTTETIASIASIASIETTV